MTPADQRLDRIHPAGPRLHLRLVVQDELAPHDRTPHLPDHRKSLRCVGVQLGLVHRGAHPAPLRRIHRHVGVPEQRVGVLTVRRTDRDPDARVRVDRDVVHFVQPCNLLRSMAATDAAAAWSDTRGRRIANSSPPKRATVSSARIAPDNREATSFSNWSPLEWPRVSLTSLKPSRSIKHHRDLPAISFCLQKRQERQVGRAAWPATC